jgi:hypothetical protein
MSKRKPDLAKIAADLELMVARVEAMHSEVFLLAEELRDLARQAAAFTHHTREYLAEVREAQIRGLR